MGLYWQRLYSHAFEANQHSFLPLKDTVMLQFGSVARFSLYFMDRYQLCNQDTTRWELEKLATRHPLWLARRKSNYHTKL
mmetsp:Transcript_10643/g.20859  ORF Transcript_10643/g.20859 Transcript_10643/m.20859 type:complete len:80 (-) Transcript_10643:1085-1324(-)